MLTSSLYLGMKAESVIPVKARRLPPKLTHLGITWFEANKNKKYKNTNRQRQPEIQKQREDTKKIMISNLQLSL